MTAPSLCVDGVAYSTSTFEAFSYDFSLYPVCHYIIKECTSYRHSRRSRCLTHDSCSVQAFRGASLATLQLPSSTQYTRMSVSADQRWLAVANGSAEDPISVFALESPLGPMYVRHARECGAVFLTHILCTFCMTLFG